MCVIAALPKGKTVTAEQLVRATTANPDGFGWAMLTRRSQLVTGWDLDADRACDRFLSLQDEHRHHVGAVFHARIATHGDVNLENCHPFPVGGDGRIMLAHNGVLPCEPGPFDDRSDTRVLCDDVIPRAGVETLWTHPHVWEKWTGSYNKLVILSAIKGRQHLVIIGERRGEWNQGVWWSNSSYQAPRYSVTTYRYVPTTAPTTATDRVHSAAETFAAAKLCPFCKTFGAKTRVADVMACDACWAGIGWSEDDRDTARETETYCEGCNLYLPVSALRATASELLCEDCAVTP